MATNNQHHENQQHKFINLQKLPHLSDYIHTLETHTNPLQNSEFYHPTKDFYISTSDVILTPVAFDLSSPISFLAYHRAGPRTHICFEAARVRAAIVTCGGLCPGLNTVIRELVVGLWNMYGVRHIFGVKSGYRGFYSIEEPVPLDPKIVHNWHKRGGTALETSRGGFDLDKIVDGIQHRGFNQV